MTQQNNVPRLVSHLAEGVIYIGRAGRGQCGLYGNPVRVGRACPECGQVHQTPSSTLPCYQIYFKRRIASDPAFRRAVLALAGRQLWCPGCRGRAMCHGQIIREWFVAGCPVESQG